MLLGGSGLEPTLFKWLDQQSREALLGIVVACEQALCWPAQVLGALISLLAKDDDSMRPIGLLSGLYRMWMASRRDVVRG